MYKNHRTAWSHGTRLGQNFLKDMGVANAVVNAATALAPKIAVEIGPGKGAITFMLARRVERLTAIEMDEALARGIRKATEPMGNVDVMEDDALRADFRGIVGGSGEGAVLVANLPYYMSTPMLRKAFQEAAFKRMVFMLQLEVAFKVCAAPGTDGYGPLAVARWASHDAEILFEVPPSAFEPVPSVRSAVVIIRRTEPKATIPYDKLMKFTDAAFMARRKNIKNALLSSPLGLGQEEIAKALSIAGLAGTERAEEIEESKICGLASILMG
ncbi:MAG: Ribosomal RNA small subunit methyltransferase A [Firmicutes bacterium ADurb.Bin153]|nr:MAG: Ribosomal RNA small subunit methyltransferase A [Firmicutes bacterium ADurb.Bin153]HPU95274.1 16S rRNA (adenine(1518)-N(6)/adenine(1519)-N(6))-dimethyltransferase RsmA [Bacillota bacterium]